MPAPEPRFALGAIACRSVADVVAACDVDPAGFAASLVDGSLATWIWEIIDDRDLAGDLRGLTHRHRHDPDLLTFLARARMAPNATTPTFAGLPLDLGSILQVARRATEAMDRAALDVVEAVWTRRLLVEYAGAILDADYYAALIRWERTVEQWLKWTSVSTRTGVIGDEERSSALAQSLLTAIDPAAETDLLARAEAIRDGLDGDDGGRTWWFRRLVEDRNDNDAWAASVVLLESHARRHGAELWRTVLERWSHTRLARVFAGVHERYEGLRTESLPGGTVRSEVSGRYFREGPGARCPWSRRPMRPSEVRRSTLDAIELVTIEALSRLGTGMPVEAADVADDIAERARSHPPVEAAFDDWCAWVRTHHRSLESHIPNAEAVGADPAMADKFVRGVMRALGVGLNSVQRALERADGLGVALLEEFEAIRGLDEVEAPSATSASELDELERAIRTIADAEEERAWRELAPLQPPSAPETGWSWPSSVERFFRNDARAERSLPTVLVLGHSTDQVGVSDVVATRGAVALAGFRDASRVRSVHMAGTEQAPAWFALVDDGTVVSWGLGHRGLLGHGWEPSSDAAAIPGLTDVQAVATRTDHALALHRDGRVSAWGCNRFGQLGVGDTRDRSSPTLVRGLTQVAEVAAGHEFSIALDRNGAVWAWGSNVLGQLGRWRAGGKHLPSRVHGLPKIVHVAAGFDDAVAIDVVGRVWAWGAGALTETNGLTPRSRRRRPRRLAGVENVRICAVGANRSVALHTDGTATYWGGAEVAIDQPATTAVSTFHRLPLGGAAALVTITCGMHHAVAVDSEGRAWSWGANHYGQAGGDGAEVLEPRPVPTYGPVTWASAGPNSTYVLDSGASSS